MVMVFIYPFENTGMFKERRGKMSFKNYTGSDKYHIRIYKKGKSHPFVVAIVEEKN